MEKTGNLLVGKVLIDTYLHDNPLLSMQSKILMLNEIIYSKYENEVLGKEVKFLQRSAESLIKNTKPISVRMTGKALCMIFTGIFCLVRRKRNMI